MLAAVEVNLGSMRCSFASNNGVFAGRHPHLREGRHDRFHVQWTGFGGPVSLPACRSRINAKIAFQTCRRASCTTERGVFRTPALFLKSGPPPSAAAAISIPRSHERRTQYLAPRAGRSCRHDRRRHDRVGRASAVVGMKAAMRHAKLVHAIVDA